MSEPRKLTQHEQKALDGMLEFMNRNEGMIILKQTNREQRTATFSAYDDLSSDPVDTFVFDPFRGRCDETD